MHPSRAPQDAAERERLALVIGSAVLEAVERAIGAGHLDQVVREAVARALARQEPAPAGTPLRNRSLADAAASSPLRTQAMAEARASSPLRTQALGVEARAPTPMRSPTLAEAEAALTAIVVGAPAGAETRLATPMRSRGLEAKAPPEAGDLVAGRYRVRVRTPSPGGDEMLVADDAVERRGVLIRLYAARPEGDLAMTRVRSTATRLIGIAHPHVATVLDCGVHGGRAYVVEAVVHGRALADVLERGEPLAEVDALRLIEQAAKGLQHVFLQTGLVHGALTPAEILVGFAGVAGARAPGDIEQAVVRGFATPRLHWQAPTGASDEAVPRYAAPEQLQDGRSIDVRADIYALGAVLFHALTGRPPFDGDAASVRAARLAGEVPDPAAACPGIGEDVRRIVMTCLAPEPERRYLSHQGLIVACERALPAGGDGRRTVRLLRQPMPGRASAPQPLSKVQQQAKPRAEVAPVDDYRPQLAPPAPASEPAAGERGRSTHTLRRRLAEPPASASTALERRRSQRAEPADQTPPPRPATRITVAHARGGTGHRTVTWLLRLLALAGCVLAAYELHLLFARLF